MAARSPPRPYSAQAAGVTRYSLSRTSALAPCSSNRATNAGPKPQERHARFLRYLNDASIAVQGTIDGRVHPDGIQPAAREVVDEIGGRERIANDVFMAK